MGTPGLRWFRGATGDSGGLGGTTGGSGSGGQGGTGGTPVADGGPDGPVDPCSPNPCAHGTCKPGTTSYTCDCTGTGYNGNGCQTDIDECATDVNECSTGNGGCDANATCTNTPGSRTCACKTGYSGDGITCTDVNECLTNNGGCDTNATCTNTTGSRTCACKTGFSGNGITCTNINDCSPNPCRNGGSCTDGIGSYTCACVSPWSGTTCGSGTLTVNASGRGFYTSTTWFPPNSGNTLTGFAGDMEYRSYFGFQIPNFTGTVDSVSLKLEVTVYDSLNPSESFFVYDVFTLDTNSVGTIKSITLTPATTGVSNARGSTFAVGVKLYTDSEGVEEAAFSNDIDTRTHQLEIRVVP